MKGERHSGVVLLVDPSCDLRTELACDAEQAGLTVIATTDPSHAVLLCQQRSPDVVITDLSQCGEAGLSLLQDLRGLGRTCPIVVVSDKWSEQTIAKAIRAGATQCLRKPIVMEEFAHVLDRVRCGAVGSTTPVSSVLRFDQRFVLTNDPSSIDEAVLWLVGETAKMMPDTMQMGLRGALQELLVNAVEHGNLEISHDEKKQAVAKGCYDALLDERAARPVLRDRRVIVEVSYDGQARRLYYRIRDQGKGFNWRTMLERKPDGVGLMDGSGRGLLLVRSLFPDLSYNERGNEAMFTVPLG
ncbi:MAG: response regulator [Nitrospira sp.]|nr:response regulator [Nitrospira sp.]MCP9456600.1 response regulator [Nitrospira sp.]